VVTCISAVFGSFGRAIEKDVFALVITHDVGLAACPFHVMERPKLFGAGFEFGLYFGPFKAFMAVFVFLKAGFQYAYQFLLLLGSQLLFGVIGFAHGYQFLFLRRSAINKPLPRR